MTTQTEQTWLTTERQEVYRGRVRLVDHSVVLGDGTRSHYEVDESIPFAVATLVIDDGAVILTRQYRYPINRWIYDLPGGAGADGEAPADAAGRELEEELGLVPNDLVLLHTYFVNPGRAAWPVHLFVCTSGTQVGVADRSDPSEQVQLVRMGVRGLDAAIANGEIVDPSVMVARAAAAVSGHLPPLGVAEHADHCGEGGQTLNESIDGPVVGLLRECLLDPHELAIGESDSFAVWGDADGDGGAKDDGRAAEEVGEHRHGQIQG